VPFAHGVLIGFLATESQRRILRRPPVPTLEERVAFLEGRVEEHARGVDGMREALVRLEERMDRRFEAVEGRFNALELEIDRRFESVDHRFDALSASIDTKIGRMIAIQVTTLAAILAAAGGILAAVT
jgi:hypothetical protein